MTYINIPSVSSDLLVAEREILTRVASGGPLTEVMRDIILMVEKPTQGEMLASILIVSEDGKHLVEGAAPSLPADYNAAIDGIAIGHGIGSCGTAAFAGSPVIVSDIANDPLWADFRDLALSHGLGACWSMPITAADGRVLGTFANYYKEPKEPTERDLELIGMVTRTTAIAIERHRNELAREKAEEQRLLLLHELNHRVKNLFALADSLLTLSARSATSVESYALAVRGRLFALHRAHELIQPGLAAPTAARVSAKEIVTLVLAPYRRGDNPIELSGPDEANVGSRATTSIALVLHEMATNAAKYGALSQPDGKLAVTWRIADGALEIDWQERGGQVKTSPSRSGFGSKLIERTVKSQLNGTVTYGWHDDGLDIALKLPLSFVSR